MAETVTLGSIANLKTGPFGTQFSASEYSATGTPILNVKSIGHGVVLRDDLDYVPDSVRDRLAAHTLVEGDIVFARKGSVDRHAYVSANEAGWIQGSDCIRVQCKHGVNSRFISHWLKLDAVKEQVNNSAVGSTMASLNTDILAGIHVRLPDPETQNAVAAFLSRVEDQVALNTQINDNLQAVALSQFMHQFFRKDPNGELSDVLIELPKSQVQVRDAKDIAGRYPFFTSGASVLRWDKPLAGGRNLLLNTGGNADVKFYVGDMAYSTDTWAVTARDGLADYAYLLLQAISPELDQKYFLGTGLRHLQKPLLKKRPIYIPSVSELRAFNAVVVPAMTMISENLRENRRLQELRDWLLPMLMNGQATVASSDKLSFT